MRHYLMVTEADFQKAVQNPVQQPSGKPGNAWQEALTVTGSADHHLYALQGVAKGCHNTPKNMAEVNGNRTHPGPLRTQHWF
jgi:hypothetical protein